MDSIDRQILNHLQFNFPLTVRPFLTIAKTIGRNEKYVIRKIADLKTAGIVRQISAIFNSYRIGYKSTLAAFKVRPAEIKKVAAYLNSLLGVSHNYQRKCRFNLWFTLTLPEAEGLKSTLARLAKRLQIKEWLYLPAMQNYKISFQLDMSEEGDAPAQNAYSPKPKNSNRKPRTNKAFIQALQKDLPLVSRPYRQTAKKLGLSEGELLRRTRDYVNNGAIRRVAAVLRQTKAGFRANVMVAWKPSSKQKRLLGEFAATKEQVSHCYERPASGKWPYSIYTMIHGRSMRECSKVIQDISTHTKVKKHLVLPTIKEYKKVRVVYYPE